MTKKTKKAKRTPWNKGMELGQRDPFSPSDVKRIRKLLVERGDAGLGHLGLFSTAIDTMLRTPDLLELTVKDVRKRNGTMLLFTVERLMSSKSTSKKAIFFV